MTHRQKKQQDDVVVQKEFANDSDDTGDEEDEDEEIPDVETLERAYESSPYSVENTVKLLMLYKMVGLNEKLSHLRSKAVELFALPEVIWVDWIEESIKDAKGPEEKKACLKLFERALEDFDCITKTYY